MKQYINEAKRMQELAGIQKEAMKKPSKFIDKLRPEMDAWEIFNDGDHRLLIIWEASTGKITVVDDFNGEDWDAIWDTEDIRPELTDYIKNYKLPTFDSED